MHQGRRAARLAEPGRPVAERPLLARAAGSRTAFIATCLPRALG